MNNEQDKIKNYFEDDRLLLEKVVQDFSNYICTIIQRSSFYFENEDIEEIILDVFFTMWKNREKLDREKKMSSYVAGITKNLIKKKYHKLITLENIEDYENTILEGRQFRTLLCK